MTTDLVADPVLRFGLLADVQYSDMPNGNAEGRVQLFKEAPDKLLAAVEVFIKQQPPLSSVLSLGDLFNGNNQHPVKRVQAFCRRWHLLSWSMWTALTEDGV